MMDLGQSGKRRTCPRLLLSLCKILIMSFTKNGEQCVGIHEDVWETCGLRLNGRERSTVGTVEFVEQFGRFKEVS